MNRIRQINPIQSHSHVFWSLVRQDVFGHGVVVPLGDGMHDSRPDQRGSSDGLVDVEHHQIDRFGFELALRVLEASGNIWKPIQVNSQSTKNEHTTMQLHAAFSTTATACDWKCSSICTRFIQSKYESVLRVCCNALKKILAYYLTYILTYLLNYKKSSPSDAMHSSGNVCHSLWNGVWSYTMTYGHEKIQQVFFGSHEEMSTPARCAADEQSSLLPYDPMFDDLALAKRLKIDQRARKYMDRTWPHL